MEEGFADIEDVEVGGNLDEVYVLDEKRDRSIEDLIDYELATDLLGDVSISPPELVNPLVIEPATYGDYCNLAHTIRTMLAQIQPEMKSQFVQTIAKSLLDGQSVAFVQRVVDRISQQQCNHLTHGDP